MKTKSDLSSMMAYKIARKLVLL